MTEPWKYTAKELAFDMTEKFGHKEALSICKKHKMNCLLQGNVDDYKLTFEVAKHIKEEAELLLINIL